MADLTAKLPQKLKATSIHLFISLLVFLFILYLIFYDWYPEPFFTAQGGWQGIKLMAFVQLILGPSLTFIVFDHLKKRRAVIFDLSVITVLQIAALVWGGYQVYAQRPLALVFWHDAFYTVTADEYSVQGIENPDFSKLSRYIPPLIYSRPLRTSIELEQFNQLTKKSIPVYAHVSLYENIEENLNSIFSHGVDIKEVMSNNASMKSKIEKVIQGNASEYYFIALKAKYRNIILVFDKNGLLKGEILAPAY